MNLLVPTPLVEAEASPLPAGLSGLETAPISPRSAYAGDLARFFICCSMHQLHVFEAQRHHLASYLAEPQPTGEQFAFKTLEQRLAAISGFYAYALELGFIDRHPRAVRTPLAVKAHRAQGAISLSKPEFERFVSAAADDPPNALAAVLLLGLYGLRVTFVTLALNEGVALRDVQDAARHADPRTTRLYARDAGALNRHPVPRLLGLTGVRTQDAAGWAGLGVILLPQGRGPDAVGRSTQRPWPQVGSGPRPS